MGTNDPTPEKGGDSFCAQVLFKDRKKLPLGVIPMDYEANQENYDKKGSLRKGRRLQPAKTSIYAGLRLYLTKNLCKEEDFVNGMQAIVQSYDDQHKCLEVTTRTGKRLAVHLVTEEVEGYGKVTCFPVRLGYACTVQKVQGTTLPHVTLFLDVPGCRAAAYVALSRVRRDGDYLIAGKVCPRHFVPAQ